MTFENFYGCAALPSLSLLLPFVPLPSPFSSFLYPHFPVEIKWFGERLSSAAGPGGPKPSNARDPSRQTTFGAFCAEKSASGERNFSAVHEIIASAHKPSRFVGDNNIILQNKRTFLCVLSTQLIS